MASHTGFSINWGIYAEGYDNSSLGLWKEEMNYRMRYFFGDGTPVDVNFNLVDIYLQPNDFSYFNNMVAHLQDYGIMDFTIDFDCKQAVDLGRWAGNVTFRLKGNLIGNDGKVDFKGYIGAYNDRFDFNWADRHFLIEAGVRAASFLQGQPYDIRFHGHRPIPISWKVY